MALSANDDAPFFPIRSTLSSCGSFPLVVIVSVYVYVHLVLNWKDAISSCWFFLLKVCPQPAKGKAVASLSLWKTFRRKSSINNNKIPDGVKLYLSCCHADELLVVLTCCIFCGDRETNLLVLSDRPARLIWLHLHDYIFAYIFVCPETEQSVRPRVFIFYYFRI